MGEGRVRRRYAASAEARVLARACAAAALLAGFAAVVPFSATAPTTLNVVFLLVGSTLSAALWRGQERTPDAVAHAVVVFATLCVTVSVAASTTPAGVAVSCLGFVWVALFSAVFHRRRALAAHLTLQLAGSAAGLVLAQASAPLQTWAFVGLTAGVVAVVVHTHVDRLRDRADLDALTGALTRSAFRSSARSVMDGARRDGEPLTLLLVDLDDFKQVNDSGGHAAGDRVLVTVTRGWRSVLTPDALIGRHGGDEFVVVLRCPPDAARQVLGRMRAATPDCAWTAGLAPWSGEDLEDWLARADADLYERKRRRPPPR